MNKNYKNKIPIARTKYYGTLEKQMLDQKQHNNKYQNFQQK